MSRIQGERVFCHQCQNEWDRAHGGLTCPRCEGDFTEILEPGEAQSSHDFDRSSSPSLPVEPPSSPPSSFDDYAALRNHNPWSEDANDDIGTDVTTFELTTAGGRGRMVLSTRTWRSDGRNVRTDELYEVIDEIGQVLTRLDELQDQGMLPPMFNLDPFGFPRGQGVGGRDDPHLHLQPAGLQDLFSLIFQSMQPEGFHTPDTDDRRRGGPTPLPFDLLHQMLNPANARAGDMVYSQEAFDRVMTQLMEQHNTSTAPPPASEEAILSLKKKKVDREMLGDEGKAECSICMDNVELNNEKIASGRDFQGGDTAGEPLRCQVHVPIPPLKAIDSTLHRFQKVPALYEKPESPTMGGDKTTICNILKPTVTQACKVT
ncbi:hypothetical protein AYO21_04953 [Fonsecaea monophora]|uniref:RING-type domain-containing protein n=1 Tax=Fonsecaea monophora TaxID=254056 RepID=A0A177FAP0_9EURO|nr:hypothetical protein AYO21_04953 [Fonsecaea monophora]OAG40876.1 hypothetical protein AYO21_04953 [Fonsecaea monophora]